MAWGCPSCFSSQAFVGDTFSSANDSIFLKLSMIQAKSDRITAELINVVWQKQGDIKQRNTKMPDMGDRI